MLANSKLEMSPCYDCYDDEVTEPSKLRIECDEWSWYVYCDDCYDGAPDSSNRNHVGRGRTRGDAIKDWNEIQDMVWDERAERLERENRD